MGKIREMLAKGDFNHMSQAQQTDGSVMVTLTKRGDNHRYILIVRDLYQTTEKVLSEKVDAA